MAGRSNSHKVVPAPDTLTTSPSILPSQRWLAPLLWLMAIAVYAVLVSGLAGRTAGSELTNLARTVSAAVTTLGCLQASRRVNGYLRRAWLLFALAYATWLIGELIWVWQEFFRKIAVPFPSTSDVFYAAFGLVSILALFALRDPSVSRPLTPRILGNLGLIVCSLAVGVVTALFEPIANTPHELAYVGIVVAQALSFMLAFVLSVYFLWSHRWGLETAPLILIVLSYAVHGGVSLLYMRELILGEFDASHYLNAVWLAPFALMHLASRAQTRIAAGASTMPAEVLEAREGHIEAVLPGLLLLALVVGAIGFHEQLSPRVLAIDAALLVAFALIMLVRESWIYTRERRLRLHLERSNAELQQARIGLEHTIAELRETEELLRITASTGNVGLFKIDLTSHKAHFSPEWKRLLGYGEHEIGDDEKEWYSRLHPDDEPRVRAWINEVIAAPSSADELEIRLRHRDGQYRWFLMQATVRCDEAGNPRLLLGSHVDITRLKAAEAALRASEARYRSLAEQLETRVAERTAELQDAYNELESFAYAVSHDLKAPLRAIDGFSHLLVESAQDKLSPMELEYVQRVRRGALRMAELIDGLLAYSRVERRKLERQEVALRSLIDELVNEMMQITRTHAVDVQVHVPDIKVHVDREALLIVLRNLLDNAIKFTRDVPMPRIEISAEVVGERVVLRVRDNGIGFDQTYHDQIFSIFQRLHANDRYEGTGIGLALSRKAVQRMQGRLWAESAPGEGATFFVEIPMG